MSRYDESRIPTIPKDVINYRGNKTESKSNNLKFKEIALGLVGLSVITCLLGAEIGQEVLGLDDQIQTAQSLEVAKNLLLCGVPATVFVGAVAGLKHLGRPPGK